MKDFQSYLKDAKKEVEETSDKDLEIETAKKWAARAIACYQAGDTERGNDYRHEALEHAAISNDGGKLVGELQKLIDAERTVEEAVDEAVDPKIFDRAKKNLLTDPEMKKHLREYDFGVKKKGQKWISTDPYNHTDSHDSEETAWAHVIERYNHLMSLSESIDSKIFDKAKLHIAGEGKHETSMAMVLDSDTDQDILHRIATHPGTQGQMFWDEIVRHPNTHPDTLKYISKKAPLPLAQEALDEYHRIKREGWGPYSPLKEAVDPKIFKDAKKELTSSPHSLLQFPHYENILKNHGYKFKHSQSDRHVDMWTRGRYSVAVDQDGWQHFKGERDLMDMTGHGSHEGLSDWLDTVHEKDLHEAEILRFPMERAGWYKIDGLEIPKSRQTGADFTHFSYRTIPSRTEGKFLHLILGHGDWNPEGEHVSTTPNEELAKHLTDAYNNGGWSRKPITRVPLGV